MPSAFFKLWGRAEVARQVHALKVGGSNPFPATKTRKMTKFLYPTEKQFRISTKYGMRKHPITKKQSMHNGVDLATTIGTVLKNTIAPGKVIKVGYDDLNGHYLRIEHNNNMLTSYAHLNLITVKEGQQINLNDEFAETGNTGSSTAPHLHFRVRIKEGNAYKDVDPELYFKFE